MVISDVKPEKYRDEDHEACEGSDSIEKDEVVKDETPRWYCATDGVRKKQFEASDAVMFN